MRFATAFVATGMILLAAVAAFAGSSYAQQTPALSTSAAFPEPELKDTVVTPHASALAIPASTVHWRGRRWNRPYWRPYTWAPYYGYPRPGYWWNGYRWIVKPRRVIIY